MFGHKQLLTTSTCLLSLVAPKCGVTAHVDANPLHPSAFLTIEKNTTTGFVTVTLPPGHPGGAGSIGGISFVTPANPTEANYVLSFYHKDPVILQLPSDWSLASATVTSPAGTGSAVMTNGPFPGAVSISANGSMSISGYYQAEPGYQLVMGDYPVGLDVDGWTTCSLVITAPPSGERVDRIKYVSTVRATLTDPVGVPVHYFLAIGQDEIDFAQVQSEAHTMTIDLTLPACPLASGSRPRLTLPHSQVVIGQPMIASANNLDPGWCALLLSDRELATPQAYGSSTCFLRVDTSSWLFAAFFAVVDPTGAASVSLPLPNDPNLVGFTTAWQPVQIDATNNAIVFGSHGKLIIEGF